MALDSACYGLIVFSELVYVSKRAAGRRQLWVLISDFGGGPVCYNVLLHQRSMLCAFVKFQIGFCDGSYGRPFHSAAMQSCQSSSGLTDGFSASRTFCHSLLYRTAWMWGFARSTSSGVTWAPMLNVEGINSFDVKIPHYTGIRGPHSSRQRRHRIQLSRYLFGSSS